MAIKKLCRALTWVLFAAMVAYFGFLIPQLPASPEGIVREANQSWAGVLRLWVCGGWSPGYGSFTPWLNACLSKFEKRNPGVYVQVTNVSESTLAAFHTGEINPPDLILFAPGMLNAPDGLLIIEETGAVRDDLRGAGAFDGAIYAIPIAMGGYALAYDTAQMGGIPDDWRALDEPKQKSGRNRATVNWLNWPADQPYASWSAALIHLFADREVYETEEGQSEARPKPVGDGVDLGLPYAPEAIEGGLTEPVQTVKTVPRHLPALLPESFREGESVYSAFTGGEAVAIPVTQREIRRLQVLSESGKGPDWSVQVIGDGFTDQLAMLAIVSADKPDREDREKLCGKLLTHFLSEESQQNLSAIRAFPVIDLPPLYDRQQGMAQLENFLRTAKLTVPNAFDPNWRGRAKLKADAWVEAERRYEAPGDAESLGE